MRQVKRDLLTRVPPMLVMMKGREEGRLVTTNSFSQATAATDDDYYE